MSNIEKANEYKALGNEAFKNKNYEQAIKYFTQAIENNPNDHVFYSNRSGSYLNAGNHEKALEDAEQCVKMNNTWPRGYQRKGTALFYLQRIDEAVEAYEEGLKHDPNNQQLQNDLKAAQDKMKANPMMNQQYLQGMMKLLSNPETKDFIKDPQFMKKVQTVMQNPAALSYFSNDPKVKKAMEVIGDPSSSAFNFEEMMKNMGKGGQAPPPKEKKQQQQFFKMDEQQPAQPQPKPQPQQKKQEPKKEEPKKQLDQSQIVKNKGNDEFKKKNFAKALQFYEQAIKLKPDEPLYYNNKAAAYIEMGDLDKANQAISQAEQIFEEGRNKEYIKKAKVFARKGSVLMKQQRYQEAIEAFNRSLIEDSAPKVKDQLRAAKRLLKQKQAKDYINPQLAEKASEEGNGFFKEGKFPAALERYQEAIKRNPDGAKYYSNLGTVYIKLMEWQRAKQNFQVCLAKDPNYIKAYGKKGDCHYAMKQYHKALQTFEKGLKLDPDNQICQNGIKKTQAAIYTSGGSQEQQQQRAQKAMADPEIQAILNTPEVQNALKDLQSNPAAIQNIMKNPSLAQKIEKLIQAGVIGMG